jgi:hypothetical protein
MEHPAIHDLAAYLEHRLDDASRRRVESHLAECDQCRREVVDGERVLRAAPDRRTSVRRPIAVLAGLAAAAVVLFTVLPRDRTGGGGPVERGPAAPVAPVTPAIVVVEPADAAQLTEAPATFVWRPSPGVSLYKFTLTDEQGRVLWSTSTRDTLLAPPGSLQVPPTARYFWYVDALRADGGTVSSGVHAFRVR